MFFRILKTLPFLLFSSCVSLSTIYIDELKPADFFVDKRIANVGIVNLAQNQRDVSHHLILGSNKPLIIDSLWNDDFNKIIITRFKSDLAEKAFFDSVWVDTLYTSHSYTQLNTPTLQLLLDSLAFERYSQGIFFLTQSQYRTTMHIEPLYTDVYFGYMEGVSKAYVSFYSSVSQQIEDSFMLTDSLFFEGQTGSLEDLSHKLPHPQDFVGQMADHLGHRLEKRYIPYWQSVERQLFVGGSYYFSKGAEFAKVKNWPDAIKVWRFAVDKGSNIEKARACYNLAVMAEIQDDVPSALEWLNQSLQNYIIKGKNHKSEIERINAYHLVLEERGKELTTLKLQVEVGE